ncbi:MAG: aspartate kinase [Verrucomicrobia bacterium]|nr:aspartate kinase [Verrucomicrobiota bacterium]MBS0647440.1 aspartate kinase [Verrucomicrobiota bacterium]
MKFGGSVLLDSKSFHALAHLILQRQQNRRVLVVVSAMQGETDRLINLAHSIHALPPRREYDMLVSVGERVSMSLLAMALHAQGAEAVSFTGSQSGVITTQDHAEAKIISVRPYRLMEALDQGKIVIVAGFQGVSEDKEITTLGRGGSDTTAVALGIALNAEVEFYKDVPGICSEDPRKNGQAFPYPLLTHQQALEIVLQTGGKVLHPRALLLAQANMLPLRLLPLHAREGEGTHIETVVSENILDRPVYEVALPIHCYSS